MSEIHDFKARLNAMFKSLRNAGYFARQSFKCCQGCGWSAVPEGNGDKAVFYHAQDRDGFRDTKDGELPEVYLAWAGDAAEIMMAARFAGLESAWDGSNSTRILVKLLAPVAEGAVR